MMTMMGPWVSVHVRRDRGLDGWWMSVWRDVVVVGFWGMWSLLMMEGLGWWCCKVRTS